MLLRGWYRFLDGCYAKYKIFSDDLLFYKSLKVSNLGLFVNIQ